MTTMTTGQLVFYGGVVLLGLTILAAIVFLVKRPTYQPEDPIYETNGAGRTQHLRNGFPTEKETIRRVSSERTEPMETEAFDDKADPTAQETEAFDDKTGLLSQEPAIHDADTAAPFRKADAPPDGPDRLDGGGEV